MQFKQFFIATVTSKKPHHQWSSKNIITTSISKEKRGTEKSMQDREYPGDRYDSFQWAPAMGSAMKPWDCSMHSSGKTE